MMEYGGTMRVYYKGYIGEYRYGNDVEMLRGRVLLGRDVVTFQGETGETVQQAFRESVDDYLDLCRERGEKPERSDQ